MKSTLIRLFAILILFSGCSVEDGADGINGIDGQDGISIGIETNALNNGCKELVFFKDLNNNGVKDSSESIISSFEICDGITPVISMISEEENSCSNGGKVFTFFIDSNSNNILDNNEQIIGSEIICYSADGVDGETYSLFITQATTEDCTNGGFIISVFNDLNGNGEYDSDTEVISNQNIICYPDRNSIEIPDFSEEGHTYSLLGVWRAYSSKGIPIAEEDRFNIYFYPDSLNPDKLVDNKRAQSGWLEFPMGSEPIGWRSTIESENGFREDHLIFEHSNIEGVDTSDIGMVTYNSKNMIVYNIGTDESYTKNLTINIPTRAVDADVWPTGLEYILFYKVE